MSKEWTPQTVFELLGDDVARAILERTSVGPVSAEVLADVIDVSLPTIYRRLHALEEYEFVTEGTHVDTDGNHFSRYAASITEFRAVLDDGSFEVSVTREPNLTEKFSELWSDLESEARRETDNRPPHSSGSTSDGN